MGTVSLETAAEVFEDLVRRAERGETIFVTCDGRPIFDIVPHRSPARGGIGSEAGEAVPLANGIVRPSGLVPDDYCDPLPGECLIRPLPKPGD